MACCGRDNVKPSRVQRTINPQNKSKQSLASEKAKSHKSKLRFSGRK